MMMMKMYFHFRVEEVILFQDWATKSVTGYIFTCFAVLAMAAFFEFAKFGRLTLGKEVDEDCSCTTSLLGCPCDGASSRGSQRSNTPFIGNHVNYLKIFMDGRHVLNSVTLIFQTFLGYCLMLVTMTYNVPLVCAVIMGHVFAYFLIGPLVSTKDQERTGDCCN
ncbi:unnamed protein product, partial [Mesorhabditis belari]|uniref:Copper transport protein n=1 Tax=Mesorhabditis belari TaxID=2138241 RepID=A0AAF3FAA8_9BILA